MKEAVAIKRINFLEQGHGILSYRMMVYALIAWLLFLCFLVGIQFLRTVLLDKAILHAKEAAVILEREKDNQMKQVQSVTKQSFGISAKLGFSDIILHRPRWSVVLSEMTRSLPPQVWLNSVDVKELKEGDYEIELGGKAKTQRVLTNFIMRLESTGAFRRTTLENSKAAEGESTLIEYTISTQPVAPGR
jgi:Tfp pilus assembly protein PilN